MLQLRILLKRVSILLLLYFLSRLVFWVIYRKYFADNSVLDLLFAFVQGIRFDLSAIVYSNCIFILFHLLPWKFFYTKSYQLGLKILFYAVNIPALLLNSIDLPFFRYTLKRTTIDQLHIQALGGGEDTWNTLPKLVGDFWYVLLVLALLVIVGEFFYRKTKITSMQGHHPRRHLAIVLPAILIFTIAARGGTQYRPLGLMHAAAYSPKNSQLILNTVFTVMQTSFKTALQEPPYFNQQELDQRYTLRHIPTNKTPFRKFNVVLILLENFSKEYVGALNNYPGYTPFLDSLSRESLVFPNAFANAKRSIEGIPACISSLPALMNEPFITSAYWGNPFESLPEVLRKKNYHTVFFHGGNNGTMGFDNFCKAAGFNEYIGRNEYPDQADYDGVWGIADEPFFRYTAQHLGTLPKPFMACLFSISSHHPFEVPAKFKGRFPEGTLPIHPTVGYTDMALRAFFANASKQAWFDSTLFIITADHTGPSDVSDYQNDLGKYAVPMLYYQHNSTLKGRSERITQQIDILPTVLDLLKFDQPYNAFGQSAVDSSLTPFAINYSNELYQYLEGDYMLQFSGDHALSLFDFRKDHLLQNNLLNSQKTLTDSLVLKVKAIAQRYNQAMIKNALLPR